MSLRLCAQEAQTWFGNNREDNSHSQVLVTEMTIDARERRLEKRCEPAEVSSAWEGAPRRVASGKFLSKKYFPRHKSHGGLDYKP